MLPRMLRQIGAASSFRSPCLVPLSRER